MEASWLCAGRAFLVTLLLLLAACASPQRAPGPAVMPQPVADFQPAMLGPGDVLEVAFFQKNNPDAQPYRLRGGDVVALTVLNHPDLSRDRVLVLPDGTIALPGIPMVRAAGRTPDELAAELARVYPKLQIRDPKVSVSVVEADIRTRALVQPTGMGPRTFVIVIDESGYIDLPFIEPVAAHRPLRAIQQEIHDAFAREFGGQLEVTVNLREREAPRVFVFGEVGAPGSVTYRAPLTALMAISSAGGFRNSANANDVRLFRLQPDGRFAVRSLALRRGSNGEIQLPAEVALRPHDILYVPKTGIAVANLWIEQYIRNMLPTNIGFGLSYDINE